MKNFIAMLVERSEDTEDKKNKISTYIGIDDEGNIVCLDANAKEKPCPEDLRKNFDELISAVEEHCSDSESIDAKEFFEAIRANRPYFAHWFTAPVGVYDDGKLQELFKAFDEYSRAVSKAFDVPLEEWVGLYNKLRKLLEFLAVNKPVEGLVMNDIGKVKSAQMNRYISITSTPTRIGVMVSITFNISNDIDALMIYKKLRNKELMINLDDQFFEKVNKAGFIDAEREAAREIVMEYNKRLEYIFS